jgi:hypothetical protein
MNMIQSCDGQAISQRDRPKQKANYTGERLKVLRPETYRRVVQLLAEPRESVSYREICGRCHVTDDTVKAIERREAIPIATRKQALMEQAARIARLAADRAAAQRLKSVIREQDRTVSLDASSISESTVSARCPQRLCISAVAICPQSMGSQPAS